MREFEAMENPKQARPVSSSLAVPRIKSLEDARMTFINKDDIKNLSQKQIMQIQYDRLRDKIDEISESSSDLSEDLFRDFDVITQENGKDVTLEVFSQSVLSQSVVITSELNTTINRASQPNYASKIATLQTLSRDLTVNSKDETKTQSQKRALLASNEAEKHGKQCLAVFLYILFTILHSASFFFANLTYEWNNLVDNLNEKGDLDPL